MAYNTYKGCFHLLEFIITGSNHSGWSLGIEPAFSHHSLTGFHQRSWEGGGIYSIIPPSPNTISNTLKV